jgi:mannose-6-phosphate isomerase-like protein (cupin superfamily)
VKHFNPHYPFNNPIYIAEIQKQDGFDAEGALLRMEPYQSGGRSVIPSPWGSNRSVDAGRADEQTISQYLAKYNLTFSKLLNPTGATSVAEPVEFCIKDLVVNAGNQLSLQRHRGREEYWVVKSGILTVIVDGHQLDVKAGEAIFIPKGSTHCMNNKTDAPVHVEELQFGICREADNVRLLDATRDNAGNPKPRATYPIRNEVEFKSAQLFAKLANQIALKNKWIINPQFDQLVSAQPA